MKIFFSECESAACCCPICGGNNLNYESWTSPEPGGEIRYPFICADCGTSGDELGTLVFDEQEVLDGSVQEKGGKANNFDISVGKETPDICPNCGKDAMSIDENINFQDEVFWYCWECTCGARGRQYYTVDFHGFEVDMNKDKLYHPKVFTVTVMHTADLGQIESVTPFNFIQIKEGINCHEALLSAIKEYLVSEKGMKKFPLSRIAGWAEIILNAPPEVFCAHGLRSLTEHNGFSIDNYSDPPGQKTSE